MRRIYDILIIAMTAFAVSSCELRPLEEPTDLVRIEVTVDTDNVSNVTSDIYNPAIGYPGISTDIIRCMFYEPGSGRLVTQGFISSKSVNERGQQVISGEISVPAGQYDILCYNFDTPNTLIRGEAAFESITAYTSDVPSALQDRFSGIMSRNGSSQERILFDPDHLVVSCDPGYVIPQHSDLYTIRTVARTVVDTYYLQVRARNVGYISSMSAVLGGLSLENRIAHDAPDSTPAAVYFDLQTSRDERIDSAQKDVICGVFNTFGKIDGAPSDLSLIFHIVSTTGQVYEKTINIDKIFATEDAVKRHWLLIDDEIVIPEPEPVDGGGFVPEVEDWEQDFETIIL